MSPSAQATKLRASGSTIGALLLSLACAPQRPPAPPLPEPPAESETEGGPSTPAEPPGDVLAAADAGVPVVDPQCGAGAPLPERRSCADVPEHLAEALSLPASERAKAVAALEGCDAAPEGLLLSLSADLGTPGCADALVEGWVGPSGNYRGPYREWLVALGLGARLERLARTPPAVPSARDKATLSDYFAKELFPWISGQAKSIQALSAQGAKLSGYGRAIVALEAGNAEMRFVEIARAVPIPSEMAGDRELSEIYYSSLDEALEPRKARGRDAALVGLIEMARLGVHRDARVDSARELLSKVFGGSHVTALDRLLVPTLPAAELRDTDQRLASLLPTPYAGILLGNREATPVLVRALLTRGLPLPFALQLESSADAESRYLGAHARFTSGTLYFRREDFQAADAELGRLLELPEVAAPLREDATLLRALSVALSAGPTDLVHLIGQGPRFADALGNLAALDALANGGGPSAGRAAFDGAYLRELIAEPGNAATWRELATRYQRAALLSRGADQKLARERQQAATATAKAIDKLPR